MVNDMNYCTVFKYIDTQEYYNIIIRYINSKEEKQKKWQSEVRARSHGNIYVT